MPTAVITGTTRGLGLEFVRQYLDRDWRVVTLNRGDSPALEALAENDRLRCLRGELDDPGGLERLADELGDVTIDQLINNAGIMGTDTFRPEDTQRQGLQDFNREEWRAVFEINLFTPMALTALLRERLAPGARVVTLSSSMGSIAENRYGGWHAYRASKAAVNCLMNSLALELGDAAIAAAVHPGWVSTDMGGPDAPTDAETSVRGMIEVIGSLQPQDSGCFIGYDGKRPAY